MEEGKSMAYTIVLGVCMLLCLLMIGRMLLGRPAPQSEPAPSAPEITGQGDGEGMTIDEQTMRSLLAQTLSLPEEQLTVRIGADATVSAAMQVERKRLQDSGLVPGSLRTALLFLPEQCKLYGAWQVGLADGAVTLSCLQAQLGDLTLPDSVTDPLTGQLCDAVNAYLAAQGCVPRALEWADGTVTVLA